MKTAIKAVERELERVETEYQTALREAEEARNLLVERQKEVVLWGEEIAQAKRALGHLRELNRPRAEREPADGHLIPPHLQTPVGAPAGELVPMSHAVGRVTWETT